MGQFDRWAHFFRSWWPPIEGQSSRRVESAALALTPAMHRGVISILLERLDRGNAEIAQLAASGVDAATVASQVECQGYLFSIRHWRLLA
jgi:hypothetical protein